MFFLHNREILFIFAACSIIKQRPKIVKKAEINEFSKLKNMKGNVWAVMLTATDGRECRWEFKGCTLTHVKDLIRGYVESCPYDCNWTIRGGGMTIRGMSRQDDWGKAAVDWKVEKRCSQASTRR